MYRMILLVLCIPVLCLATQVVQDDWSSGPGTAGPVTSWIASFDECENVSWMSVAGQLCLSSVPLADPEIGIVDSDIQGVYVADVGDLNGDGFNDIIAGGYLAPSFDAWFADGQGGWSREIISSDADSPAGADVADVDQDGDLDVLCATYQGGRLLLFLNQGGNPVQWTEVILTADFKGAHDVEAWDMDLDGDLDILAASAEGDRIAWWRNDGGDPLTWIEQNISTSVDYPCRIQAVDLDGDGNIDVVASAWLGDRIAAWYGTGGSQPSWTEQTVFYPVFGAHSVRACDLDMDGDQDLVATSLDSGQLLLFRNEGGSPVTWNREVLAASAGIGYARTGDIDGDGYPDIAACSFSTASGAAWWENDGSGKGWTKHEITAYMGSISCSLPADVDNDGALDVVICCRTINRLCWFDVNDFLSSGWLESSILDTQCSPQWSSMEWLVDLPVSTSMSVQYRTSNDFGNLGNWSSEEYYPVELSGILKRYFQYRINLYSSDPDNSPQVDEFWLNWDPDGIEGGEMESTMQLCVLGGNPTHGSFILQAGGFAEGNGFVSAYDASGRLTWSREVQLNDDPVQLAVEDLPSGTYRIMLLDSEGSAALLPVVVLAD